ncbi:MAG: sugar kinase [Coriobacteriia bacterium]|nr:sugar kinase [Coriobacteriia bacterium]
MSLLVAGTYPVPGGETLLGEVCSDADGCLSVAGRRLPSGQGTAAMLAAALAVSRHLAVEAPTALLAGDIGRGEGTRAVFARLPQAVEELRPSVLAFHYLQPVMALMRGALDALAPRLRSGPLTLVADAGGMYAAKAAGLAPRFELMTPDVGEIGFLADPRVTHPAYVSRYLFGAPGFEPDELVRLAHDGGGASRVLLVKGAVDRVAVEGRVTQTIRQPCVPALEAIGGTGDTVTGLAAGLMTAGFPTEDAARCAALANRHAGEALKARPDHTAADIAARFPEVLSKGLCGWSGEACAPSRRPGRAAAGGPPT